MPGRQTCVDICWPWKLPWHIWQPFLHRAEGSLLYLVCRKGSISQVSAVPMNNPFLGNKNPPNSSYENLGWLWRLFLTCGNHMLGSGRHKEVPFTSSDHLDETWTFQESFKARPSHVGPRRVGLGDTPLKYGILMGWLFKAWLHDFVWSSYAWNIMKWLLSGEIHPNYLSRISQVRAFPPSARWSHQFHHSHLFWGCGETTILQPGIHSCTRSLYQVTVP